MTTKQLIKIKKALRADRAKEVEKLARAIKNDDRTFAAICENQISMIDAEMRDLD